MNITIIMPAYNVAPFIATAIESVLAQTHGDWTLRVVDDGSTDATATIAARFESDRVQLLHAGHGGVSAARNRGIAAAEGAALMFLDSDDWLAPDALARLNAALEADPEAVAAYGGYCFVSEDGSERLETKTGPFPAGDILERLLVRNLFANGGHMLIRAGAVHRLVGFRSDLRYGEDWEFWVRLAGIGEFAVAPGAEPLLFVRRRQGSAVLRLGSRPAVFGPCMQAIFNAPGLHERLGPRRFAKLRELAEAENRWVIGRELIRHGHRAEGLCWLRRSVLARPTARRAALLLAAHALPLLPAHLRGPFRSYRTVLTPAARPG